MEVYARHADALYGAAYNILREREGCKSALVIVDYVLTLGGKRLNRGSVDCRLKAAEAKVCAQVEVLLEEMLRILREVYMRKVA